MWLRRVLISLWGLNELSADTPSEVDWIALPDACVLQLHWPPTDELLSLLERHSFKTVAISRHPLDVLISILHFAQRQPGTARWLNGEGGNELSLLVAEPCSQAFRDYAVGPRAHALLGVTLAWQRSAYLDGLARFEDVVASPRREVTRLVDELGLGSVDELDRVLKAVSFETMQASTSNGHFWRGQPGLWRRLLPSPQAHEIAAAHQASFAALGYAVDPDPALTEEIARETWTTLDEDAPDPPQFTARVADSRVESYLELSHSRSRDVVADVYRLLLRREPDPDGYTRAQDQLANGTLSVATLVRELVASPEAYNVLLFDEAAAFARWARQVGERPRELEVPLRASATVLGIRWALARCRGQTDVLDVGFAFAEPAYLAALVDLGASSLVGVDLAQGTAPEQMKTLVADVRALPLPRASFDLALCLSTLQHVGWDNRGYGLSAEEDGDGAIRCLRELRRVLRPGGSLLVTVPCGEEQHLGMFVQHPVESWRGLFEAADFFVFEQEVYELGLDGWRSRTEFDPRGVRYAERGPTASAILCAELRAGRRRNAARHSLANLRFGLGA